MLTRFACAVALLFVVGCAQAQAMPPPASGDLLCIGDSIRIGWSQYIKCTQPNENCGDTEYGLWRLDAWTEGRHWRTIVFNFGLHDIFNDVPVDQYARNLREIVHRLKADKVYFVLSTPGRPRFGNNQPPEIVEAYNRAARAVMASEHVEVIDLWTLAMAHREWWKRGRDVHYTAQGYAAFAQYIERALRERQPSREQPAPASTRRSPGA
jgi:hypothetical protein